MTKAKPRTAAEPRVGLVCDQCRSEASFIKVFHIPKKAPQYLQSQILRRVLGVGGATWLEQTCLGVQHIPPPPLSLSIAKLNFSVLCLVLLSLLVKHKIIVIKRQMWKMAKGGNIPIFNRTGGIFLGSGLKQLEWDHCHQSWPEAMVCYPVNPFPSRQPPPHHPLSHRQRVTAWGHGTARPDRHPHTAL